MFLLKKDESADIEDHAPIDALAEFAPAIRAIQREYRTKRQLSKVAKQLGFHQSRLTEMITKNEKGQYKKRITPYYVAKFLDGGIMSVSARYCRGANWKNFLIVQDSPPW